MLGKMDELAHKLLSKLLDSADKHSAGVRVRAPALSLSNLKSYRELGHKLRLICEDSLLAAQSFGCITVIRDKHNSEAGLVEKVVLADIEKLAEFLGKKTLTSKVQDAVKSLELYVDEFPIIKEVLSKWKSASKVRGLGPETVEDWLDAIKVINCARYRLANDTSLEPIREFSTTIFKKSKRIEQLTTYADILLADSIQSKSREQSEVWQEIGLYREERPVLLSGNIVIHRTKVTSLLDEPYVGFKADSVLSIDSPIEMIISIENLTTFHSEAKRRSSDNVLLLYTGGMPTPAWRRMYIRLLKSIALTVPVFHWGDIDEGGFRISYLLSKDALTAGHVVKPFKMNPSSIPIDKRVDAQDCTVNKMIYYCKLAGWNDLVYEIEKTRITIEQESL